MEKVKNDLIESLEILILNEEDDFDRGRGYIIVERWIQEEKKDNNKVKNDLLEEIETLIKEKRTELDNGEGTKILRQYIESKETKPEIDGCQYANIEDD